MTLYCPYPIQVRRSMLPKQLWDTLFGPNRPNRNIEQLDSFQHTLVVRNEWNITKCSLLRSHHLLLVNENANNPTLPLQK